MPDKGTKGELAGKAESTAAGSQDFSKIAQELLPRTWQHLQHAQQIQKDLEGADAKTPDTKSKSDNPTKKKP